MFQCLNIQAQDSPTTKDTVTYLIIKNDGAEYSGKILSHTPREILMESTTIGQVIIPKHEIKEIVPLTGKRKHHNDIFATRYFITTNGLPIEKGDSYVQWNLYGPDYQFAVNDHFGVGIMTSWVGIPIIGNAKYSFQLDKNLHMSVGALIGTGSWAAYELGFALPFMSATYGNRTSNITVSAGYGGLIYQEDREGTALISIAGISKINKRISLVMDSFISPASTNSAGKGFALIIPGIRWQSQADRAFQFGFGGFVYDNEVTPAFVPMIQWYRKID